MLILSKCLFDSYIIIIALLITVHSVVENQVNPSAESHKEDQVGKGHLHHVMNNPHEGGGDGAQGAVQLEPVEVVQEQEDDAFGRNKHIT